jgi:TonB family protein
MRLKMKAKYLLFVLIISFAGAFAQQKEGAKLLKADESGFIQVDKAPALISELKPVYPNEAKLSGIEGSVYLKLLIDENGNVAKAKVERGVKDILDNSALTAVKKAKFSPAMVNSKPIKVWVVLPISFKLDVDKKGAPGNSDEPGMNDFIKVQKPPEMTEAVKPAYPEEAKKNDIDGKVFVKLLIDKEGNPKKAIVIKSDNEILNQPAIDAAMKSKFTAAINDGQPIAVWIVLPYRFATDGGKSTEDKSSSTKDGGVFNYNSVDEAVQGYNRWIMRVENPDELRKIGANVPEDIKVGRIDENISFGDEAALYKGVSSKEGISYGLIVRKGKTVYVHMAKTLDGIHGYIDGLKSLLK